MLVRFGWTRFPVLFPVNSEEKLTLGLQYAFGIQGHFCSSPPKSSSSENWFGVLGFRQEKLPSVAGVRMNTISWLLCPRVKFRTGCLLPSVLTKKFALGISNWLSRSLTHLKVMVFSFRMNNVSTVHLPNVQRNNRTRTTNPALYPALVAIACSSTQYPKLCTLAKYFFVHEAIVQHRIKLPTA